MDLLVVQDIFPSETAQLAHVILPAAASLEKTAPFTNTERRVQRIRRWWPTLARRARLADHRRWRRVSTPEDGRAAPAGYWQYASPEAIFDEIGR
jgi:formate dehydrogenase major subunit